MVNIDDSPATLYHWELATYPEGAIQKFQSSIDLKALDKTLKVLRKLAGEEGVHNSLILTVYQPGKYGIHYHQPTYSSHNVTMQSPSRTFQAEANYSPSEMRVKVYPNKGESDVKYEIGGSSSYDYWSQQNKYEGRIDHPSLTSPLEMRLHVADSTQRREGSFELEIFDDVEDKFTGTLYSSWQTKNTFKIEASVRSRVGCKAILLWKKKNVN